MSTQSLWAPNREQVVDDTLDDASEEDVPRWWQLPLLWRVLRCCVWIGALFWIACLSLALLYTTTLNQLAPHSTAASAAICAALVACYTAARAVTSIMDEVDGKRR